MLLQGSRGRAARTALGALSRRFLALRSRSIVDPTLGDGHAGLALAHASLESALPGEGHARLSSRALARAIDGLATAPLDASLWSGIAGIAWVAEMLQGDPDAHPDDDPLAAIDELLATYLARSPFTDPYDVTQGLVGLGVYALERLPRPSGAALVALVVERLEETATRLPQGIAWRSDLEWTPPEWRGRPHLEWNLGVAHGVPGVIALLGGVCAARVPSRVGERAHALLEGAVSWLLAHELPPGGRGRFATGLGPGTPGSGARAAWCYGDPGIAATLLVAARATGEKRWKKEAIRVALAAVARPVETCGVVDAGLCHGAAGLAHMFHRIYLTVGDARFADAARSWFARALAMRGAHRGFAGFASWGARADGTSGWLAAPGVLTGAAGVALALVAATTDVEPSWDRGLLLSVRPPFGLAGRPHPSSSASPRRRRA